MSFEQTQSIPTWHLILALLGLGVLVFSIWMAVASFFGKGHQSGTVDACERACAGQTMACLDVITVNGKPYAKCDSTTYVIPIGVTEK